MDHPLSHQVLVNRQIRTPLRGSLAWSLLEENMHVLLLEPTDERGVVVALEGFCVSPRLRLQGPELIPNILSPTLWGFYFLPM